MKQWDVWSECGINRETAPRDDERASGVERAHKNSTEIHDTYSHKTHSGVIKGYGMSTVTAQVWRDTQQETNCWQEHLDKRRLSW